MRTPTSQLVRWLAVAGLMTIAALTLSACKDESNSQANAPAEGRSTVEPKADAPARYDRKDERFTRAPVQTAVAPAPKPTTALPPDATCVTAECHATYASSTFVHAPVAAKNCFLCHEQETPETGPHVYPLKRTGNDTCTFCHAVTGTRQHTHQAILTVGCVACHDPHAAPTRNLIREVSVDRLCARCHDLPLQNFAHEPFAQGNCTICHEPHESDFKSLLRGGDGPDFCFTCHAELKKRIDDSTEVHKPASDTCTGCHDPHTSANVAQLHQPITRTCYSCHPQLQNTVEDSRETHMAATQDRACANCHDPHASNVQPLLAQHEDKLCLTCHDRNQTTPDGRAVPQIATSMARPFLHGPIRLGECAPCHNPHGSDNPNILRTAFPDSFYAPFKLDNYALCFTCHDAALVTTENTTSLTGFRDHDRNLHYVHVHRDERGRTCKTCHNVHGSDLPNHIADSVPFEGSAWAMPIQYVKRDDGGSCTPGCHEKKTYTRDADQVKHEP